MRGSRLPANFRCPMRAASLQDFWRRWHITLSRWLRDYLYIPLGGNRAASAIVYRNLFVTFLLGGVCQGAAWTFVIWGALDGPAGCTQKWWASTGRHMPKPAGIVLTFLFVNVAWVYFRAPDIETANGLLLAMARPQFGGPAVLFAAWPLLLAASVIVWLFPNSQAIASRNWNGKVVLSGALTGAAAVVALVATN